MRGLFFVLTIIGGLLGGLILVGTLLTSEGAPQEAAGAAIAIAFVTIPYCMARAIEKLGQEPVSKTLERYWEQERVRSTQPTMSDVTQPRPTMQPGDPNYQVRPRT